MLELLLNNIVVKLKLDKALDVEISDAPEPGEGFRIELTERADALAGELVCPVDRTATDVEETIFCPVCMTPYHADCVMILAERGEKCWGCNKFERFDLLIQR